MKRFVCLLLLGLVIVGLNASHVTLAQGSGGRQISIVLCHVVTSRTLPNGNTVVLGGTIELQGPIRLVLRQLIRHLRHGDIPVLNGQAGQCCGFCRTPTGRPCPVRLD